MKVFTTCGSEPLLRARDKMSCLQILSSHGIPIPKTLYINNQMFLRSISDKIDQFPKILKLLSGTHGIGVIKIDDYNILESMMEAMMGVGQKVLLQEFIKESSGVDIRAFVVDGKVVASMMRQAQEGEFRSNLHRGASAISIELSDLEADTAVASAEAMGLKVAGVDMLRSKSGPLVLEVNASPGLEGIEKSTGVDVAQAIIDFISRNVNI
jgi:ribosomal protein S6--L-glutamate ligase